MNAQKFGSFIAAVRKEKTMTQAELAAKINVTDKAVSRWERGLGFPDISTMEPLADALGVTVLELMRSERSGGEAPSDSDISRALTDTVDMVQKQKDMDHRNLMTGCICLFMTILTTMIVGTQSFPWVVVFYCCAAGVSVGRGYLKDTEDPQMRRICHGVIFFSVTVGISTLAMILPEILAERYADLFGFMVTIYLSYQLIRTLLNTLQNPSRMKKGRVAILASANLAVLCFVVFSAKAQIDRMLSDATDPQVNAAFQYASALVQKDCQITSDDFTGWAVTSAAPTGSYPESCYAVFMYVDNSGEEASYGYKIGFNRDLDFTVLEQGPEVGNKIVSVNIKEED